MMLSNFSYMSHLVISGSRQCHEKIKILNLRWYQAGANSTWTEKSRKSSTIDRVLFVFYDNLSNQNTNPAVTEIKLVWEYSWMHHPCTVINDFVNYLLPIFKRNFRKWKCLRLTISFLSGACPTCVSFTNKMQGNWRGC